MCSDFDKTTNKLVKETINMCFLTNFVKKNFSIGESIEPAILSLPIGATTKNKLVKSGTLLLVLVDLKVATHKIPDKFRKRLIYFVSCPKNLNALIASTKNLGKILLVIHTIETKPRNFVGNSYNQSHLPDNKISRKQ